MEEKKYVLIYKTWRSKSLVVTEEEFVKMGGREKTEKDYEILEIENTLEETLAKFVLRERLTTRDTKVLASCFNVELEKIKRPNLNIPLFKTVKFSVQVSKGTYEEISRIAQEENISELECANELMKSGLFEYLKEHPLDE